MRSEALPVVLSLVFALGCAGVKITPISPQRALALHQTEANESGYVVYEPMVVVEITSKEVCLKKDKDGKCTESIVQCTAGAPFVLPDYRKPYLVDVKSGFGKSGADITITDGWRLGNIKDNSDNTAVLGSVQKLLEGNLSGLLRAPSGLAPEKSTERPIPSGLYRVDLTPDSNNKIGLVLLQSYVSGSKSSD
ncbi:hypothetical protein GETHPA_08150 [Geothrix rubra]|uniref:Lipoprotein n=1 Tax=Geothrix rubra TaxID=2927977 RepID=A0ABQ5Q3M5_9BACT|nr:hypothetical protein [Geothrix rubra]GLH69282.1 hypothetical protein GETHPA_08150 [Geothrix rubra]